ncbi:MAG: DNA-3-methyladenine glycosylase [Patescibacteria group bacterium]|nr:DNA-3-methyladenine glycosylase [Patescibacteria group bacterium]
MSEITKLEDSKLSKKFFERETHKVCRDLLGKYLVFQNRDNFKIGRIVEVEAYQGFEDKASHASKKKTSRNEVMYGAGGYYYIYLIYGMYYCLNIVTEKESYPAAILIRAIEPTYDSTRDLDKMSVKEKRVLGSGPGRLCRWLDIDKSYNGKSVEDESLFITSSNVVISDMFRDLDSRNKFENDNKNIVRAKRVGVDYAGKSANYEWRYYIKDNKFISRL